MADSKQDFPEDVNVVPAEDGTTWVEIASAGTEDEASILQGFLAAEGIEAQIESVNFSMEPVNFGKLGDIRVYVPADDEQRTQQLLRERDQEFQRLDDDEETLITDDGPAEIGDGVEVESAAAEKDDATRP